MSLATLDAFNADPSLVWQFYYYWRSIALSAQPNDAHHIISKLLVPKYLKKVAPKAKSCHLVMQNVDELSTLAFLLHSAELNTKTKKAAIPRTSIVEMHGRLFDVNCTQSECGYSHEDHSCAICPALAAADESFQTIQDTGTINRAIPLEELPCCGKCGALAHLGVVCFGKKPYHIDEIHMLVYKANMILVIGTSSTVHPALMFAYCVKRQGGKVAIFNLESTLQDAAADFAFTGAYEVVLPFLFLELV
ncbi:sirtuin 5 [Moniliophthora roreri]|nr:sirtuin 5 [Moniliophthora roreri]